MGRATSVVAADDKDATIATGEIQTFVEKMSGAKLPIVAEGDTFQAGGIVIYVGHTEAAKKAGNKIQVISAKEKARWAKAIRVVKDNWIKKANDKGLNGDMLLKELLAMMQG